MSERKTGWYWVKHKNQSNWEPDYWCGNDWMCADAGSHDEIGPRIPTPDESWQCVPTNIPTIDMTEAGMNHVMRGQDWERAQKCWAAMLRAAPHPSDPTYE